MQLALQDEGWRGFVESKMTKDWDKELDEEQFKIANELLYQVQVSSVDDVSEEALDFLKNLLND